jgi:hypothetical protein
MRLTAEEVARTHTQVFNAALLSRALDTLATSVRRRLHARASRWVPGASDRRLFNREIARVLPQPPG